MFELWIFILVVLGIATPWYVTTAYAVLTIGGFLGVFHWLYLRERAVEEASGKILKVDFSSK